MKSKVLMGVASLAIVAFMPHTSFANRAQGARQVIKAGEKVGKTVRSSGQIGSSAAQGANLGAAAGVAGGVAAGADAAGAAKAGASCNAFNNLSSSDRKLLSRVAEEGLMNMGQACAQKILDNSETKKNVMGIAQAAFKNRAAIAKGDKSGYYKDFAKNTSIASTPEEAAIVNQQLIESACGVGVSI